jgi:membrane-bound serine protease (ClpP class)
MKLKSYTKIVGFIIPVIFLLPFIVSSQGKTVYVAKVEGAVNPVSAEFIVDSIEAAELEGAECVIIQLDTPGGLDTSMRLIVKRMLNASIPVVVYVAPSGARAGSAGVMITMAAHVAAMAPGTNIGAAHPVPMGEQKISREMSEKIENDAVAYIQGIATQRNRNAEWAEKAVRESVSVKAEEALELNVIDLVSPDLEDLLNSLDGRTVEVQGTDVTLATKDAQTKAINMNLRDRILYTLSDPNIAYILMMLGVAGIYFELMHPGAIFPGVIGAICLILGFYSLQTLPVNYAGLLLIVLAVGLFILEIKVTSYGLLSVGGLTCLVLGSLMLFDSPAPYLRLSLNVLVVTVLLVAGFFILVAGLVARAQLRKPASGSEGLVGMKGVAKTALSPQGKVFVHGEFWDAYSDEDIREGEGIEVVAMEGLKAKVKRV